MLASSLNSPDTLASYLGHQFRDDWRSKKEVFKNYPLTVLFWSQCLLFNSFFIYYFGAFQLAGSIISFSLSCTSHHVFIMDSWSTLLTSSSFTVIDTDLHKTWHSLFGYCLNLLVRYIMIWAPCSPLLNVNVRLLLMLLIKYW